MSFLFKQRTSLSDVGVDDRRGSAHQGSVTVTPDKALRHSGVWACLRLRADLVSTMPLDAFRRTSDGVQVEVTKPPVLVTPGGEKVDITDWLYASQFDLDRSGNTVGLITATSGLKLPARIELVPLSDVSVRGKGSEIVEWKIGQRTYTPEQVWHERQFVVSGVPLGLSPVAYAAMSIGGYLSAQQFALDWFANDVAPMGTLRHQTEENISAKVARTMKDRFKEAVAGRDIFVTGSEWEWTPAAADASQAAFLDQMQFGLADVSRFFGVPADMIDAAGSSSSITYANITQRNLQLLIMNLGPAITRRERALSRLLPRPQFVKFNTDAILRMDPASVVTSLKTEIDARMIAPSEARALRNRAPYTDDQIAEFDRLFGKGQQAPQQQMKAENGATP
ncbi:MAG: phage portal protein [Candidatus Nanopelagicales bacterium]